MSVCRVAVDVRHNSWLFVGGWEQQAGSRLWWCRVSDRPVGPSRTGWRWPHACLAGWRGPCLASLWVAEKCVQAAQRAVQASGQPWDETLQLTGGVRSQDAGSLEMGAGVRGRLAGPLSGQAYELGGRRMQLAPESGRRRVGSAALGAQAAASARGAGRAASPAQPGWRGGAPDLPFQTSRSWQPALNAVIRQCNIRQCNVRQCIIRQCRHMYRRAVACDAHNRSDWKELHANAGPSPPGSFACINSMVTKALKILLVDSLSRQNLVSNASYLTRQLDRKIHKIVSSTAFSHICVRPCL